MAVDEQAVLFSNVIAGLPKIADVIASVAEEKRPLALNAFAQSYFRIARAAGYRESEASEWVLAVMKKLRNEIETAVGAAGIMHY